MDGWPRRILGDLAVVVAYVALGALATQFVVLDTLTVWYPPAGLAMAYATLRGWRAFPALAVGEVVVGLMLFGVGDEVGWLLVPNGIAYAAVYTLAGRWLSRLGASAPTVSWRRPAGIVLVGVLVAPGLAAVVGVSFQLLAGLLEPADVGRALLVRHLGDAVGAAAVGVTIVTITVRARRGGRWWAIPNVPTWLSLVLALSPALLLVVLGATFDDVVPFAAIVLAPFLALCVVGGVPAAGLAALPTSIAMTLVAERAFPDDIIGLTDLQLLQLVVIATGVFVASVVEERRELNLRLTESEGHLRTAQIQARAGSFTWDVLDDDVQWSDGLFHLLGLERRPTDVRTYLDLVHPDDREQVVRRLREAVRRGEGYESTHRVRTATAEELTVRAFVQPRVFDGRVVEVVGTITDVTHEERARQRLEEALAREHAAVEAERTARRVQEQAVAETEHAERVKEALLVAVSHEIRTPLTIIRGIAETIRRPEMAATLVPDSPMLERLDRNSRRLERVLTDLLDVDRLRRGVVEPRRQVTDLHVLVEDVLRLVGADRSRVTVEIDDSIAQFPLDAGITARILEHLLRNASRHAPGARITVSAAGVGESLELRVEDGGPGIPADERARLRQAFRTGGDDDHSPGTGVGLYLVDRFAALQGGEVSLVDRDEGGTSVRVLLPRETVVPDLEHA